MAEHHMVNWAGLQASPVTLVTHGDYGGHVRVITDSYTTDGTEAAADTIVCGQLMPGERYLDGFVIYGALGASTTLQLGDAGDTDRYLASGSSASADNRDCRALAGVGYLNETTDPIPLFLTVGGATLTAAVSIRTMLFVTRAG